MTRSYTVPKKVSLFFIRLQHILDGIEKAGLCSQPFKKKLIAKVYLLSVASFLCLYFLHFLVVD